MDHEFRKSPSNIIPKMWDVQERNGYCEVGKGQKPKMMVLIMMTHDVDRRAIFTHASNLNTTFIICNS